MLIAIILPTYVCPLACKYCYNEGERQGVMPHETMRKVVAEIHSYACAHPELGGVKYLWHGGEPMVAGVGFFEEVVALQKQLAWKVPYTNGMQSNGVLMDDTWLEFLKRESFRVTFSLDGTRELNDLTRVDHKGRGSFDRIVEAYRRTRAADMETGVVLTITRHTAPHAESIYRWFATEGIPFSLLPLLNAGNTRDNLDELSLLPSDYLKAWTMMYDIWLEANPYVYVTNFVHETRAVLAGRPYMCTGLANCADSTFAVEPDGSVYPCGSLTANPELRYGSLMENTLQEVMTSNVALGLRNRTHASDCLECKWFHTCHGGCMSRAHKYKGTVHVKDYFCDALFGIYDHIERRMAERGMKAPEPHSTHLDKNLGYSGIQSMTTVPGNGRRIIPISALL